ncbi:hypothetical protein HG537_0A02580 [Torulaspora globosa]|uniref:Uncharacterized protein n=1 Tax=Torulaspora globosa TaxID=48254 RepID=A0A7H9HLF7_9SACH|nr:hypothetical protein HG537_0A02580 [Torulaspora sp. CBS 2947]
MMYRSIYGSARRYATISKLVSRPAFEEIFPRKRMINRILFELDSRLSFKKLYPLFESSYNGMDGDEILLGSHVSGSDVMLMKKVLEKVRSRTKSANIHLLKLESVLLDKAAELGDKDAIALVAFDVLKDPSRNSQEDVNYAKLLIKDLYKREHHLTLKLTGDLALRSGERSRAAEYYRHFLKLEDDTYLAGEVYGQLGQMSFQNTDLLLAEQYFRKAIALSPLEYSVHSYYYLGQIYMNSDPLKARTLMESCATQGYRESFKALGFLEMHYFGDLYKAQEWFKLGMELYELECFIGYFDCCVSLSEWTLAKKCLKSLEKMGDANETYKTVVGQFMEARKEKVEKALSFDPDPSLTKDGNELSIKQNKWGL